MARTRKTSKSIREPAHIRHPKHKILRDLIIVIASFAAAVELVHIGAFNFIANASKGNYFLSSFIAGGLFTSTFTIAPAAVVLAEIARTNPPYVIAFWGALGSMLGDLVLFNFIKHNLSTDAEDLISRARYERLTSIFHLRIFRWLWPLVGAILIASPLPDEIGLAFMGFSRMRTSIFLPISFTMNFVGILFICLVARSI